jgi:hypothetical protein
MDRFRVFLVIAIAFLLISCDQTSSTTEQKLDSIGKKFDSTANRTWDSTKSKARDIKEKVEGMIENRDSAN